MSVLPRDSANCTSTQSIAELSVPSIRGVLTGLFEIAYQVGSVIGFWVNYGINKNMNVKSSLSWRIPMAIQLIPAAILLAGGFFLHESPLWLMRKGRETEAKEALVQLRHLPVEHQCECLDASHRDCNTDLSQISKKTSKICKQD